MYERERRREIETEFCVVSILNVIKQHLVLFMNEHSSDIPLIQTVPFSSMFRGFIGL